MTNEVYQILLNRIRQVIATVAIFPETKPGWQPGAGALLDGCATLEKWPNCSEQELQALASTLVDFRGDGKFQHLDTVSMVLSRIVQHRLRWELRRGHPVWQFTVVKWDLASRLTTGCPEEDRAWVEWVYTQAPGLRPGSGDSVKARAAVFQATEEMLRALNARTQSGEMEKWMPQGHPDYGQGYDPLAPLIRGIQALRRIATEPPGNPGDPQDWEVLEAVHPWAFKQSPDYRKSFLNKNPNLALGRRCFGWSCTAS